MDSNSGFSFSEVGSLNPSYSVTIQEITDATQTYYDKTTGNASLNLTNNLSDISAGNVRGTGSLIKDGEKSLTLTGDNSGFGGNFDIKKGDVIFDADNDKYISGSTNVSSDGALKVSNNSDFVVPTISGTGLLDKDGSGNLILIGDNTGFNGDLTVRNGGFALGAGSQISGLHSGTFENNTTINLQNTNIVDLGHGYKGVLSAFIGYNGSHQSFNGISMNHNGGTLGATGTLYKGNFFTGLTVSTGASAGEAYTSFGTDRFSMLTAGIASRTGLTWKLGKSPERVDKGTTVKKVIKSTNTVKKSSL